MRRIINITLQREDLRSFELNGFNHRGDRFRLNNQLQGFSQIAPSNVRICKL
jgi:hypothetical protein